jgi:hypothetical protein
MREEMVLYASGPSVAQAVQRMRAAQRQTELPGMTMDHGRTVQRVSP